MSNKEEQEQKNKNEPVFEGGPTLGKVQNWKQKYPAVYRIDFENQTFIYRTLDRAEYKTIMNSFDSGNEEAEDVVDLGQHQNKSTWMQEEKVCNMCVLWPENYDHNDMQNGPAGTPSVLSDNILAKSGFSAKGAPEKL